MSAERGELLRPGDGVRPPRHADATQTRRWLTVLVIASADGSGDHEGLRECTFACGDGIVRDGTLGPILEREWLGRRIT